LREMVADRIDSWTHELGSVKNALKKID
jgi:hypothetical protein